MSSSPAEPGGARTVSPALLRAWALPEPKGAKRSRGQVLVVGGARSTPGAVMLGGLAALRAGAGVLHLATAASTAVAVAVAIPEAGVTGLAESASGAVLGSSAALLAKQLSSSDAVLIGPGLDDGEQARDLLLGIIPQLPDRASVVLDAFALGSLRSAGQRIEPVAGRLVLTPNTTELALLAGIAEDDIDDVPSVVRAVAASYSCVVTCHGIIAGADGGFYDTAAGHAGLGTSGSGDVLAGAITGLLARGADPMQAACWGTYLHAAAGDRLAARVGRLGFIARELLAEIPLVLTELAA